MRFRTEIKALGMKGVVEHQRPIMLIGSCFSDNIGSRLRRELFDVTINPTGTLYNPESIALMTERLAEGRKFEAADMEYDGEKWLSYHHHGSYSHPDRAIALERINDDFTAAIEKLKEAKTVVLTYGTTRIFTLSETGNVVANCHKRPAALFKEKTLSVEEVEASVSRALKALRRVNPEVTVIFTVSPIRHTGASLADNSLSKATLRVAVARVCAELPDCIYFPAYEIMIDDLRDYRFYEADMKHPSGVAVDYIYEIFKESFMDEATLEAARECGKLSGRLSHRIEGDTLTPSQERFQEQTRLMVEEIKRKYGYLDRKILER